ncbi:MAG: class I SAM-dependent methyltransferase [Candidatus Micrarchaeia archaeon]
MMFVKVAASAAESAKKALRKANMLDNNASVKYNNGYVYFPIKAAGQSAPKALKGFPLISGASVVRMRSSKKRGSESFSQMLKRILTRGEAKELANGYDLLGSIAIIELSDKLDRKEKAIASALLSSNRNIKTVLKKAGPVHGIYRTRKLKYIAGERTFMARYKENGCTFVFDVRKVFFSNRLSFERSRLSGLVGSKERVMVMFAGVGPFAIEIAKQHRDSKVVAIELNKHAYEYMKANIALNKTHNVEPVLGDVRKASAAYVNFADRIIMPMPKSSMLFLDQALAVAKKHAFVHLYTFAPSEDPFGEVRGKLEEHAMRHGYNVKIFGERVVRPYSASESEVVVDFEIAKR